jgi:hypothetical protein
MHIHLVIIQPAGYIHSLGFLDSARFLRYQFRRLGFQATIGKNRTQSGAINIVFGAHLGFPESWERDYTCVIFNQEQLGVGGAALPPAYMALLRRSHVLDYDAANIPSYGGESERSGLLRAVAPLLCAQYLHNAKGALELENRPIDLLFIGSMNHSRQQLISRVESCGVAVSHFDHPMYGPERDHYIAQSKAILNIPFYESTRFEQTRVFNSLSIGTPVVALRRPELIVDPAFESTVHWFDEENLDTFFSCQFNTEQWFRVSREHLNQWRANDGYGSYEALAYQLTQLPTSSEASCVRCMPKAEQLVEVEPAPKVIRRLNLSAERGYRPDWVNAASKDSGVVKDIALDLESLNAAIDKTFVSDHVGHYALRAGELAEAYLSCWCGSLPSPAQLMGLQNLLSHQGSLTLDIFLGVFPDVDERPTLAFAMSEGQVRLLQEETFRVSCTDGTLELLRCELKKEAAASCPGKIWTGRFTFIKRDRTSRELVLTRMVRDDFSGLPDDIMESKRPKVS